MTNIKRIRWATGVSFFSDKPELLASSGAVRHINCSVSEQISLIRKHTAKRQSAMFTLSALGKPRITKTGQLIGLWLFSDLAARFSDKAGNAEWWFRHGFALIATWLLVALLAEVWKRKP
jgi:hypothetical protein